MKYDATETFNLINTMQPLHDEALNYIDALEIYLNDIIDNNEFSGEYATNIKAYFQEAHITSLDILRNLITELQIQGKQLKEKCLELDNNEQAIIDCDFLEEDLLIRLRNSKNNFNESYDLIQGYLSKISDLVDVDYPSNHLDDDINAATYNINMIIDDTNSLSELKIFAYAKDILASIKSMIKFLKANNNGIVGPSSYKPGSLADKAFYQEYLTKKVDKFALENGITKPTNMSDKDYLAYINQLMKDKYNLTKDGWDKPALDIYMNKAKEILNDENTDKLKRLNEQLAEVYQVGSELFSAMYLAFGMPSFLSDTQISKNKLELLLKLMGGYIDENGMLQIIGKYQFDLDMPPHSKFLNDLADIVQNAYPEGITGDNPIDKQVHQLRMYIDKNNIEYIRDKFKKDGMSDDDALRAYVFASIEDGGLGGELMIAEWARYHNKYPDKLKTIEKIEKYFRENGYNKKRLINDNFHSEFIIDKDGNFISQWNILKESKDGKIISDPSAYDLDSTYIQNQLVNGESFNYAQVNNYSHELLDSIPPETLDHDLRDEKKDKWYYQKKEKYDYDKEKESTKDDYSK